MHVISRKPFVEAMQRYPQCASSILALYKVLERGSFATPNALKNVLPSSDNFKYKDKWWVIDIGGNKLRMIAQIEFQHQKLFVKAIVSHAEYDKLCKKYAGETR